MPIRNAFAISCLAAFVLPFTLPAQWEDDRFHDVRLLPFGIAGNPDVNISSCSDGSGGAYVAISTTTQGPGLPNLPNYIRVQHITADGSLPWDTAGLVLAQEAFQLVDPRVAPAPGGGFYLAYHAQNATVENRIVQLQRFNANGQPVWPDGPISPFAWPANLLLIKNVAITVDDANGVYIATTISHGGSGSMRVQRVAHDGSTMWQPEGLVLESGDTRDPEVMADGEGGVYVSYQRYIASGNRLMLQRFDAEGEVLFDSGNLQVNTLGFYMGKSRRMVLGPAGEAVLTWERYSGGSPTVFLQRVSPAGVMAWSPEVIVCEADGNRYRPALALDEAGGAYVAWYDARDHPERKIFIQRIGPDGSRLWDPDGVLVDEQISTAQNDPQIVADGQGGVRVFWRSARQAEMGVGNHTRLQVFDSRGEAMCPATGYQMASGGLRPSLLGAIVPAQDDATLLILEGPSRWPHAKLIPAGCPFLVGITEHTQPAPLTVYPNPVTNGTQLTVEWDREVYRELRLLDLQGRLIRSTDIQGRSERSIVPIDGLRAGPYLLEAIGHGHRAQARIMVME